MRNPTATPTISNLRSILYNLSSYDLYSYVTQLNQVLERSNRMPSPEMEARLKKIVAEQLGVDESKIVPSARFSDDLNADSLDLVEMIMSLEEEFGVEIPDEDAEKILTVGDAINYIDSHAQAA